MIGLLFGPPRNRYLGRRGKHLVTERHYEKRYVAAIRVDGKSDGGGMVDLIGSSADTPFSQSGAVRSAFRPKALGLVRTELSGSDTAAHALGIQCYADYLGYRWIFTVRPPQGTLDPVGYTLCIAASMEAAAIIVIDPTHVDHRTDIGTAGFDLLTITPPRLWRVGALEPVGLLHGEVTTEMACRGAGLRGCHCAEAVSEGVPRGRGPGRSQS
ncbi:hypothetical protein [Nocardia africana]|uniref:Uncharacterized protein n=1 Tax=Nocardia africana TaxID=134964 RepID=A0ABW6NLT3_9NOCA